MPSLLMTKRSKLLAVVATTVMLFVTMTNLALAAAMLNDTAEHQGMMDDSVSTLSATTPCHDSMWMTDSSEHYHSEYQYDQSMADHDQIFNCCKDKCQLCAITITGIVSEISIAQTIVPTDIFVSQYFNLADPHSANLYRPPNLA